jgi:hypothetical protein
MIKRYSHLSKVDKASIMSLIRDDNSEMIEPLKEIYRYNEILAIVVPMMFDNMFQDLHCEFVTSLDTRGAKIGFFMEKTGSLVLLDLMIDEQKIELLVSLPNSSTIQRTTLDFPVYWTRSLWSDCLMVTSVMKYRRDTIRNMIRLVDYDTTDLLPN